MIKTIITIAAVIGIIIIFRKAKKKADKIEYRDRTTKQWRRWHK